MKIITSTFLIVALLISFTLNLIFSNEISNLQLENKKNELEYNNLLDYHNLMYRNERAEQISLVKEISEMKIAFNNLRIQLHGLVNSLNGERR